MPAAEEELGDRTPRPDPTNTPRVCHPDSEPSRAWKYGPEGGRGPSKTTLRNDPPPFGRDPAYSGSDSEWEADDRSEYSYASHHTGVNEDDGDAPNEEVFDPWRANQKNSFSTCPTRAQLDAANLSPAVARAVREVRGLRFRPGCRTPHTAAMDVSMERAPLTPRNTARVDVTIGRHFLNKATMKSDSQATRQAAYLTQRSTLVSLLTAGVTARQDGKVLLDKCLDEIVALRGPMDNLSTLCTQIVAELSMYVCLASSCIVWACDSCYCDGWTAQKEFLDYARRSGEELLDTIANVELLWLASVGLDHLPRSVIYSTEFATTHGGAVQAVHDQIVSACAKGDQPWARKISDEFSIANHNARVLARTQAEEERPRILQATAVAFGSNLVGKDRAWSEEYAKNRPAKQHNANHDTRTAEARSGQQERGRDRARERPIGAVTRAAAQHEEKPGRTPYRGTDRQDTRLTGPDRQDSRLSNTGSAPDQLATQYRIDWNKVKEAGTGEKGPLRSIAAMLFPTDDCTDFNARLSEEGWPKASSVVRGPDGAPRLRPDNTIDTRYLRTRGDGENGKGDPDCRYCAIYLRHGRNGSQINKQTLPEGQLNGGHNPKRCPLAIAALMKTKEGTHFLEDRSKGRYK